MTQLVVENLYKRKPKNQISNIYWPFWEVKMREFNLSYDEVVIATGRNTISPLNSRGLVWDVQPNNWEPVTVDGVELEDFL